MNDLLDETKTITPLTDKEVFSKIWLNPRKVFEFIHLYKFDKFMVLLIILNGISNSFDKAVSKDLFDIKSLPVTLLIIILGGIISGFIGFYFYSAFVSWTGNWLKGKASTSEIVRVLAYGSLPSVGSLVLVILQLIIFKGYLSTTDGLLYDSFNVSNLLLLFFLLLELILSIWSIVLTVVGVAVVQDFSIGKAIFNLILPVLILTVIFVPFLFLLQ
jgi:hypothetical protein